MSLRILDNKLETFMPQIIEQAKHGITITNPHLNDNPIVYVNDGFCEMFGYEKEEILGRNCRFLQGEEKDQSVLKEIKHAIINAKPIKTSVKNYKKNGELIHSEIFITPIFDESDQLVYFLGIQKDITKEKILTEQMKVSQQLANIGNWEFDLRTNKLYWSDEIFNIFEIDKNNFNPSYETLLRFIHPDDRDMVNKAYIKSLNQKKKYSIQHRLLMDDGRVKYVEGRCDNFFNKNGVPYKSVGTIQNITDIKEIEFELKNMISLFESYKVAMDESSIVSKADLKGNITYVNENFCKISGYTKEEVIGKPHSIIRHPDNDKAIFEDLWSTIKAKKVWKKIIKNIDKYGNYYWVDTTIVPILDKNNNIIEYIATRHDITETIDQKKRLDDIANTDSLTNLGSRYKLINDIEQSTKPALAILNIDRFTEINDFYGYKTADNLLIEFGKNLKEISKDKFCDIYRIHSDEFIVFCKDIEQDKFLEQIEFIQESLSHKKYYIDDDFINLDFTIGISFETKDKILNSANMVMKIAKNYNKSKMIYSDQISLDKEYENNIKWAKKIKESIQKDNVIAVYQALLNNKTEKVEKYEALVRIQDNETLISPYFFLELSKKTKFYNQITKIMIDKTIKTFKNSDLEFSINLTIEDILNDEIKNYIYQFLDTTQIGSRVVFEIVESESIENFELVSAFIEKVKSFGSKIAIDDFGTGYSNFEYLLKLKADYIKIDGSIIKNIDKDPLSEKVCKNLVNFAKDLGMKTIAEFVESESLYKKVKELGIDYSQGYYIGKPKSTI